VNEERVGQFMRRGAITCSEETSLRFVAQIMMVNRIRYCVVTNKDHEVVGLISADNIINAFGRDFDQTRAKDVLIPNTIVTVTTLTSLKEAVAFMAKKKIEHLIVVSERAESKAVIGMLCSADIIARMARRQEQEVPP